MRTFAVDFSGSVEIEAESKEEARSKAAQKINSGWAEIHIESVTDLGEEEEN